jgi:hypothetical protein
MQSRCLFTNNNYIYKCILQTTNGIFRLTSLKQEPFRKICQTKNLHDSDPDLTSSSLVTFGPNFDCILFHIQNFTWRRFSANFKPYMKNIGPEIAVFVSWCQTSHTFDLDVARLRKRWSPLAIYSAITKYKCVYHRSRKFYQ